MPHPNAITDSYPIPWHFCGRWSTTGQTDDGSWHVPLFCHRWDCYRCGAQKVRQLLSRLEDVEAQRFMTLSCNPARWASPTEAFYGLSKAVGLLAKRIRTAFGPGAFEYCLIWEVTRKGWPHIHLLTRGAFIPQRWLSACWKELTDAPVVDIRQIVSNVQLAAYVLKYITKAPEAPMKMKRYRFSRRFLKPRDHPHPTRYEGAVNWKVDYRSIDEVKQDALRQGKRVVAFDDGCIFVPNAPLSENFDSLPQTFKGWPVEAVASLLRKEPGAPQAPPP